MPLGTPTEDGLRCRACAQQVHTRHLACMACGLAVDDPWLFRVLEGRYKITGWIGQGGMGRVYRGEQIRLRRPVAIKILATGHLSQARALEQFRTEALAAARLAHPNVIPTLDFGLYEDTPYIVMEQVDGVPLEELLSTEGVLPVAHALRIAMQAAHGLGTAHARGIVHRDVKPGNIMVAKRGPIEQALVLDFGLARLMPQPGDIARATIGDAALGTPYYSAPEQLSGLGADARSDVYALGATLFEMLTGRPPFMEGSVYEIALRHLKDPPMAPSSYRSQLGAQIDDLVLSMLEKDPDLRPAHGLEVFERIRALDLVARPEDWSPAVREQAVLAIGGAETEALELFSQRVEPAGGTVAQTVGQETLAVLPNAEYALRLALECRRGHLGQRLRVGLSFGPVYMESGIAFGEGVRLAVSLARLARPSQALCTEQLRARIGVSVRGHLTPNGEMRLAGLGRIVSTLRLRELDHESQPVGLLQAPGRISDDQLIFRCRCGQLGRVHLSGAKDSSSTPRVITVCARCSRQLSVLLDAPSAVDTPAPYTSPPQDALQIGASKDAPATDSNILADLASLD